MRSLVPPPFTAALPWWRAARAAWILLTTILMVGCGSNEAAVPPALLDAIAKQSGTADYPQGPYGTNVGDVVQNLCFQGWRDPGAAAYEPSKLETICLSDFHDDPDAKLMLIESCAVWCAACRIEYGGTPSRPSFDAQFRARKSAGFRVLGSLFQNQIAGPADGNDLATWARNYSLSFPFVLDDTDQMALFNTAAVAPYNLLVDTRTMKIVLELDGDEPAVLFGKVDDFLATPTK